MEIGTVPIKPFQGSIIENVGRPLVGLLTGNKDSLLYCPGDPQGASLHLFRVYF